MMQCVKGCYRCISKMIYHNGVTPNASHPLDINVLAPFVRILQHKKETNIYT